MIERGERLGDFRLERRISIGSTAEVWLARRPGDERPVVIKRLHPHCARDRRFSRVLFEALQAAGRVRHTNLVQIEAWSEADHFVCLEYVPGVDLGRLVHALRKRRELMPPAVAASLVADACAGLHQLHTLRDVDGAPTPVHHGAVSPFDIRVTPEGIAKVNGVGFARAEQQLDHSLGIMKGKMQFISPERLRGQAVDFRSDLFELGLVLFEALTNTRAFVGDSELQTIKALVGASTPAVSALVPSLSPQLEEIVQRALQREPARRFASAEAMRLALDEYVRSSTREVPARLVADVVSRAQVQ